MKGQVEHLPDVLWGFVGVAVGGDGAGIVAFGETFAGVVADQPVMVVDRGGQVEELLQQHVDLRGVEQVLAADDVGDVSGRRRR